MPEQWTQAPAISGEKRLVFAVLESAIADLHSRHDDDAAAARRWLRLGDVGLLTLNDILDGLDIDRAWFRRALHRKRKQRKPRIFLPLAHQLGTGLARPQPRGPRKQRAA